MTVRRRRGDVAPRRECGGGAGCVCDSFACGCMHTTVPPRGGTTTGRETCALQRFLRAGQGGMGTIRPMSSDETTSIDEEAHGMTTVAPRKPLFDHPVALLILITVTVGLLAGFTTLQIRSSNNEGDTCASTLGSFRVYMAQTAPPSIFDTVAWDELTVQYNDVFTVCDVDVAGEFTELEFDPWAEPALSAFDSLVDEQQSSSPETPATSATDPSVTDTRTEDVTTPTTSVEELPEYSTDTPVDTPVEQVDDSAGNETVVGGAGDEAVGESAAVESLSLVQGGVDTASAVDVDATRLIDAQRLVGAQDCPQRGIVDILPVDDEDVRVVWWRMSCDAGLISCTGRIVIADDGSYFSERGSCATDTEQAAFVSDVYDH